MEFHYHIWNHHEKYIEISINVPVIGSVIHELAVKISEVISGITTPILGMIVLC